MRTVSAGHITLAGQHHRDDEPQRRPEVEGKPRYLLWKISLDTEVTKSSPHEIIWQDTKM